MTFPTTTARRPSEEVITEADIEKLEREILEQPYEPPRLYLPASMKLHSVEQYLPATLTVVYY